MIEIDLNPDTRTLRQFGFIALVGFGLLAVAAWYEVLVFSFGLGGSRPYVAGSLAVVAGLASIFSLIHPRANLGLYLGLTILAYPIGFALSYLILGVLFFLVVTPVGLVLRLCGRDAMERRRLPDAESYWVDARGGRSDQSYFKQL